MAPKLYLLLALYGTILVSTSHAKLRDYVRKLGFARRRKGRLTSQA